MYDVGQVNEGVCCPVHIPGAVGFSELVEFFLHELDSEGIGLAVQKGGFRGDRNSEFLMEVDDVLPLAKLSRRIAPHNGLLDYFGLILH